MSAVSSAEVAIGLVVHLNPEILKVLGGSLVKCAPGSEVKDNHYFLIVDVNSEKNECTAFPLYSQKKDIRDRVCLEEPFKSGKADHWIGIPSFYFKWQFWRIPLDNIPQASLEDDSEPQERRFYAANHPDKLASMTSVMSRSRDEWRYPEA
ncbi:MAG: hypothetical protein P4N41_20970 [Negativicutes bacterium]|jgi:hypothetical protein|nr:hypothetical protein [Negativicutes bacterium]